MPAVRRAFAAACDRSAECRALGGSSLARIARLLDELRRHRPTIRFAFPNGDEELPVTADAESIIQVMLSNYMGPVALREFDAAARAYLERWDSRPLIRLIADAYSVLDPTIQPASEFSEGLFIATRCSDYELLFDVAAAPAVRQEEFGRHIGRIEAESPTLYEPFTVAEYWGVEGGRAFDSCLYWPPPSPAHPQGRPVPRDSVFPDLPTLVLSSEFDTIATVEEGADIARRFPRGRQLVFANSLHVAAVDDGQGCAAGIVRRFVVDLDPRPTDCADNLPPIRLVPSFATWLTDVVPAEADANGRASGRDLRLAAAAVHTVADVIARWHTDWDAKGRGLRGGFWRYAWDRNCHRFDLDKVRWTIDVAVSGTACRANGATTADVSIEGPDAQRGVLKLAWADRRSEARARIAGRIGDRAVQASMPAP
jgi:hypothetical protein